MGRNQMFSSDWYRRQVRNEINLLLSSGAGKRTGRSEIPMSNLFQPGKKKDKKKNFKNGMPEGLENDSQSSENDHWKEASGEWTDEPQETFVQMTLQDLMEISEDEEVPAARQQKLPEISEEATLHSRKRKKRGKKAHAGKQQREPQQIKTNTAQQQTIKKKQPEKTTASVYTKSVEELQEIILWSEILGEPAAVRRRKRKVNQQYGDQSNAYRR